MNMDNYIKLVADSAKHMLPKNKDFFKSNVDIIRLPNGIFKTFLIIDDKHLLFMVKPFTENLRRKHLSEGNTVKVFNTDDFECDVDKIKWSDKAEFTYYDETSRSGHEIVSLFAVILSYAKYDKSYIHDFNPTSVCHYISFNMKNVLKAVQ